MCSATFSQSGCVAVQDQEVATKGDGPGIIAAASEPGHEVFLVAPTPMKQSMDEQDRRHGFNPPQSRIESWPQDEEQRSPRNQGKPLHLLASIPVRPGAGFAPVGPEEEVTIVPTAAPEQGLRCYAEA